MRSGFLKIGCAAGLVGSTLLASGPQTPSAASFPTDNPTIVHVLNRVAFGPRPSDIERVRAVGLQGYIEQQLRPDRIGDGAMEVRLAGFPTLHMSSREISADYERPAMEARRQQQQRQAAGANQPETAQPRMPDPLQQRANRVMVELSEAKMLRAVYSERQLDEVLTDFWFNHFNVDARKGADRFLLTAYERDAIRPHVLGKFRDLLEATAKSPAMLFYLDNWMSADPNGPHAEMLPPRVVRGPFGGRMIQPRVRPQPQGKNAPKGLNENYGRELMELHTLGVDG